MEHLPVRTRPARRPPRCPRAADERQDPRARAGDDGRDARARASAATSRAVAGMAAARYCWCSRSSVAGSSRSGAGTAPPPAGRPDRRRARRRRAGRSAAAGPERVDVASCVGGHAAAPASATRRGSTRTARGRVRRRPGDGEPAEQRGRGVVRVALDRGGQLASSASWSDSAPARARPASTPATDRRGRRAEPPPVRDAVACSHRLQGRPVERPRGRRPRAPSGRRGAPSPRDGVGTLAVDVHRDRRPDRPSTRTRTSSCRARARPRASKPGPRFALTSRDDRDA